MSSHTQAARVCFGHIEHAEHMTGETGEDLSIFHDHGDPQQEEKKRLKMGSLMSTQSVLGSPSSSGRLSCTDAHDVHWLGN